MLILAPRPRRAEDGEAQGGADPDHGPRRHREAEAGEPPPDNPRLGPPSAEPLPRPPSVRGAFVARAAARGGRLSALTPEAGCPLLQVLKEKEPGNKALLKELANEVEEIKKRAK